jgi:DNA-binding transcriptional LysR family regulator
MDRLQQLRFFTRVVERGNLSRAARDLDSTQPTVSKALTALEKSLRTQLVLRSTRQVTLTDAGRRFYERARGLLEAWDEASGELSEGDVPRGVLRVHGPVVLGERYVGPIAVEFQRRFPEVRCELTFLDSFVSLVGEGADLTVRLGSVNDPTLHRRKLGSMRRLLVAAPHYLARRGVPRRPVDLRAHDSVRFSGLPTSALELGTESVEIGTAFLANNAVVLRQALVGGLGIGLVTQWLVDDDLREGTLVEVLPKTPPRPLEVNVLFPTSRFIPRRVRAFVDALEAGLATAPGMEPVRPR